MFEKIVSPISSKYQITIPAEVRQEMNINSSNFEITWIKFEKGKYLFSAQKKLGKNENPFLRSFGILKELGNGKIVDEFIAERRKDALKE